MKDGPLPPPSADAPLTLRQGPATAIYLNSANQTWIKLPYFGHSWGVLNLPSYILELRKL